MTHAYCLHYGHENWRKNDLLTARAKKGYRIEECTRCGETRRIWKG